MSKTSDLSDDRLRRILDCSLSLRVSISIINHSVIRIHSSAKHLGSDQRPLVYERMQDVTEESSVALRAFCLMILL